MPTFPKGTLIVLVVAALLAAVAHASIMGIDLGNDFIKIAAQRPDNSMIEIVLNEQARRKSSNYVGFRGEERFIGDDAKALAPRFPTNMFPMPTKLLGVAFNDSSRKEFTDDLFFPVTLVEDEKRGTIMMKAEGNPETAFSVDELSAMMLSYAKSISEKHTGAKIREAAITVPAHYDSWRRQALVDAAKLAGLRVLSIIRATTATALQFGIQRRGFGNETAILVVYDMGTSSTEVGVFRFRPTTPPAKGQVKLSESFGTIETLAVVTDEQLGGRLFDSCIAKKIQAEFMEKLNIAPVLGADGIANKKATLSVMRAACNARERLSANQDSPVTVENVVPGKDFSTTLSRDTFEGLCPSLFQRATAVAQRALDEAGISTFDVNHFELMGGGSRIPKVIADLTDFLGRPVDRTLNTDEAAAMGAAFYAARLSSSVRVRSFAVVDKVDEQVSFQVSQDDECTVFGKPRMLFDHEAIGSHKSITLNRTKNFQIRLLVTHHNESRLMGIVNVSGVPEAMETLGVETPKLPHPNNTAAVRITFKISEMGIPTVMDGEARFRYAFNRTKKVKVNVTSPSDAGASSNDNTNETAAAPVYENRYSIIMKRKLSPVDVSFKWAWPFLMDGEETAIAKERLTALAKGEELKEAIAVAKNDLETYMQWVKYDGILDNEEMKEKGYLTAEQEETIRAQVKASQTWLEEGPGSEESVTLEALQEQLVKIRGVVNPVFEPYNAWKNPPEESKPKAKAAAGKNVKAKKKKAKASEPEVKKAGKEEAPTNDEL